MLLLRYIRSYKVRAIKVKFIILYLLNVTDIIFTLLLMDINFPAFFIKTCITLLLLLILSLKLRNYGDKPLFHSNIIIMTCVVSYILINLASIITEFSKFI